LSEGRSHTSCLSEGRSHTSCLSEGLSHTSCWGRLKYSLFSYENIGNLMILSRSYATSYNNNLIMLCEVEVKQISC
jgi:hypothetical protein